MRTNSFFVVCCVLTLGMASCDRLPGYFIPTSEGTAVVNQATSDATPQMTAIPSTQEVPFVTPSIDSANTISLAPPISSTSTLEYTPTPIVPCDSAAAGRPIDVTIPDDSVISAGSSFTKIWRLVNTGSCTWTTDYAVVWFSGDRFGSVTTQNLSRQVKSGESIDIAVDMTAPTEAGVKQSFWKLQNGTSQMFGIGPASNAPFWVRIIVQETSVAVPTDMPEPTATPVILAQGAVDLLPGESLNLDTGEMVSSLTNDLTLVSGINSFSLQPGAGVILGTVGDVVPTLFDCQQVNQNTEAIMLVDLPLGTYFCYQTDQGMPGVARLTDLTTDGIRLDFSTWAIP